MNPDELSFYLLMAIMSMAICMAIIPVMMRVAPYIGMVDDPDERKVHTVAIPRSGGVGIVIGLLYPDLFLAGIFYAVFLSSFFCDIICL